MQEIEVEEYVRLTSGIIDKIIEIKTVSTKMDGNHLYAFRLENYPHICREYFQIVKHSKNIIDLIEVRDYVNGKLISNVDKVDNKNFIEWEDGEMYSTEIKNDNFIKSIVTKQQFESIEYKI